MSERNLTPSRLKEALLERLIAVMEDGEVVVDKDGEPMMQTPSASFMTAAINFLKEFPPVDDLPPPMDIKGDMKKYTSIMPVR